MQQRARNLRLNERLHFFGQQGLRFLHTRFERAERGAGSTLNHALHDADNCAFSGISARVRKSVDDVSQSFVVYCGTHELTES